ncbi:ebhA protein [Gardnerella vaginalis 6119V5]|uniref:FIVAR domain-containing protein n=1 Tax=Gardnerella vaginalis TaxID=2702 RepID=UPI00026351A9|nr:FIVAR domain-containing protein [Gardnerella vaginalis]EIK87103.1 ebhA protein [Gardnerella vaginalis 6119V5]
MASSNSRKHARKVTLDAAVSNAIEKAVDTRKVAAFTVGAAGVLAGAAFAFGATPAMAAEAGVAPDAKSAPVTAGEKAGAESGKAADGKADAKSEVKEDEAKEADKENQTGEKDQTDTNKEVGEQSAKKEDTTEEQNKQSVVKTDDKKSDEEKQKQETTTAADTTTDGQDREASTTPEPKPQSNSTIELSQDKKDTLPNMYAWGKSDNVYVESGQNTSVTFKFAAPADGYKISNIAIFPTDTNGVENTKSRKYLEYYSAPGAENEHKPYSGTYDFKVKDDGSATLTMTKLYRDGSLKSGESYSANRCIYVYGKKDGGKDVLLYKTNIVRAATLIPPKNAGSIVLQYDEQLTDEQIRTRLKESLNAPTAAKDGKSVRDQITAASKAFGVGGRTGANGAFVQTPDNPDEKVVITDNRAYLPTELARINKVTSQQGQPTTYVTGVNNLKTYLVSDLGYKSEALPLTVARYDTRIDKPVVTDPNNISDDVKKEIAKKLANLNHIPQDKVTINADGTVTINFEGVDPSLAPKINLSDLVLKKLEEADVNVPTGEKAVFVYNPLDYSKDEIARIKKAIYEANKKNDKLGLSDTDYEKQISLSYLTGNLTASGTGNQGISNGRQENTITVKIKTDKAVAEFTSDVTKSKLTKFVNIREDYTVSWTKDKIDGRNSDEGLSWSEDHKTIIYRYDPTKAVAFKSSDITKLLTATPKAGKAGLRVLKGDEHIDHEGEPGKEKKSHVYYVIDSNGEPTGALTLGIMNSGYWTGDPQITGTEVDRGNVLSKTGEYKWDDDAKPVTLASKDGKIYRARLFVAPYGMESYQYVYTHPDGKNPNNTTKAINVIFVPQTNHKTKDLKTSVEGHKLAADKKTPIDSAYYNASKDKKDAYDEALKEANAALEAAGNTEYSKLSEALKARIDNATINLNKAREALDGAKTDKEKLKASIDENGKAAEGNNPATLTQATNQFKNVSDPDFKDANGNPDTKKNEDAKAAKKAYDEALQAAEAARDDENATQKAVDDAKAKLDEARKKLNDFTTNKDELSAAIAKDGKVNTGEAGKTGDEKLKTADPTYQNSTKEERDAYDKAVAEAQKVVADPNASQKEVNEAIKKLKDAKAALDKNATDKSPLDAAVQKSFDNPDPTKPDKQSVFYKNAKAKTNDPDAQQVVKNYDDALKKAKEVLANDKATKADVEKAKKDLEDAEAALHADKYSTDKTDLGKALADNFSGYLMPAYFNAFDKAQAEGKDSQAAKDFKAYNDAYHAAKDLMDELNKPGSTVDQNKVDAVKKQLLDARKIIDTYATDTSRLSAAVFNDIAIKNSPAYKNLKALAEKTNPTPEEQADVEAAKKAMEAYKKAAEKLHNAITNKLPRDKANGQDIPDSNIPKKDGDLNDKDYLKDIQAHKNGEPLNKDVDSIIKEMNAAAAELNKFATKTDELIKSINEDATTHPSPAFKNASQHKYQKPDGSGPDDDKNNAAKAAAEAYGKALNEAKDLLNNPNATQKDINDAKDKLDKARKALDAYNTDVAKLEKSVGEHGKDAEGTNPAVEGTKDSDAYRNASDPHFVDETGKPDEVKNQQAREAKTAYDKALTEAQALLAKHNDAKTPQDAKPTQVEIDAALEKLDEARKTLVGDDGALDKPGFGTNTTDLDVELAKSSPVDATDPTPGTVEDLTTYKNALAKKGEKGKENPDITRYKEALKKATELAAKQKSTKASERPLQKDVDEAYRALLDAKKIIADGYKTDATALQDEAALGADDGNFTKSPEYKNADAKKGADDDDNDELKAYKAALTEVTTMLNNFGKDGKPSAGVDDKDLPTQAQVDAALKKLSDARKAVEAKYKTKTDKLENEVGDKDETGQPVTPPFEASVAYKNALEKANAESEEDAKKDTSATKKLKDYADKLKAAQELINKVNNPDPNAKPEDRPTQDEVDKALAALKQAKKDIDDNFKTKVDDLQKEVDDKDETGKEHDPKFENTTEFANLKAKIDGDKKPDDLVAYEQALAKARELIKKNTGKMTDPQDPNNEIDVPKDQLPTQKEVDEALQTLKDIKEKILANYKTSPKDLQDEVDKSKDGDKDKRDGLFENTPAFKNVTNNSSDTAKKDLQDYNDKLAAAKKLLDAFERSTGEVKKKLPAGMNQAPTQKELDDALKALQDAKKKIENDYSTVKYDLRQEAGDDFTKSPEYQNAQAKGDDESKQALDEYKNALDEANSVLADPNATQAEVDAALKRLQDAKAKLKAGNSTDKSKLQDEADDDANFRKSPYFIIGNKADIEAYENALAEARSVLADPNATQAQVDAALKKLEDAKKRILDFLSHFGGSGNGTGDWNGHGFVNGHESYGALVDKSALQIEVNNAVDANANTAQAVAYRQALAEAKSVLNDPNATQAQVDAALRKLQAAKAALLNSLSGASGHKIAKTGAATGLFAGFAVIFAGLGAAGVASRRRKHSKE